MRWILVSRANICTVLLFLVAYAIDVSVITQYKTDCGVYTSKIMLLSITASRNNGIIGVSYSITS
jgi:hypothetical protein